MTSSCTLMVGGPFGNGWAQLEEAMTWLASPRAEVGRLKSQKHKTWVLQEHD